MSAFAQLFEVVGFDIILLGLITIAFMMMGYVLWKFPSEHAKDSLLECHDLLEPLNTWILRGALLLAAASLGMVANQLSDELLEKIPAYSPWKRLGREDQIKSYVVNQIANTKSISLDEDGARYFIQQAYVGMLASNNTDTKHMLRFEYLEVRFLRVVFLGFLLLLILAVASGIRITMLRAKTPQKDGSANDSKTKKWERMFLRAMAMVSIAAFGTFIALWLSGEQFSRYSKKLTHAFLAEVNGNDRVFSLEVLKNFQQKPEAISDLTKLPGFVSAAEFWNPEGKKADMFEFSGLTALGEHVFVVDNETGKLKPNNSAGITDKEKQAFFEVIIDESAPPAVRRVWTKSFAKLAENSGADDLEALTTLSNVIYAIGSHSSNSEGVYETNRHVFLRISGANSETNEPTIELSTALTEILNGLTNQTTIGFKTAELSDEMNVKHQTLAGLNIEGLSSAPGIQGLLIGLRGPLKPRAGGVGDAIILQLANPSALFDVPNTKPELSVFTTLPLDGDGISALEYDPDSKSMLVGSSGIEIPGKVMTTHLWQWKTPFNENRPEKIMSIFGHKLEGICRIPNDVPHAGALLLAFDEELPGSVKRQFGRLVIVKLEP